MQQNLRLNATAETGLPLTPNDTDVSSNWTLPKTLVGSDTTVSGWVNDNEKPYSATFNNTEYGTYYNWCAATAGTCISTKSAGQVATGSICPKGWHLPTGGGSDTIGIGEFSILNGLNFAAVQQSPYSFPAAGFVHNSILNTTGSSGGYWSSTAYFDIRAYGLGFSSSAFRPGTGYDDRSNGYSVRCVADEGTGMWIMPDSTTLKTDLNNMQDITKANFSEKYCANTTAANALVPEGSAMNLRDIRDRKIYTVYKAADGNCWMGQNLALSGPIDLNSDDTDLVAGTTWTLPVDATTWSTSNNDAVQVKTGSTSLSGWKNGFGNYYSWPAATAGSGTTAVVNTEVAVSICPKGWKLPMDSGNYSFQNLTDTKSSWVSNATINGVSGLSGYYFGSAKTTVYKSANFWLAAGLIRQTSNTLDEGGRNGSYWSRRVNNSTVYAANLGFGDPTVSYQASGTRRFGFSVRCVAEPAN